MTGNRRVASRWATTGLVLAILVPTGAAPAKPVERNRADASATISFLPVEPAMQAAYADARGFFERQGVDAELRVVADPSLLPAAVLSGQVQFSALNVGGLANLKARGVPVKLIASGALYRPKAPTTALVAAPGKRFTRARDLVGKRIAIDARTTIAHVGLLKWLKRGGVSQEDVTLVELRGFAQMMGPLGRGQVDAAVLPEPYLSQLPRGSRRIATIFDAVCAKDCLITVWIARKDVDANLASRFRNAIQAAALWANQKRNQQASAAVLARYAPIDAAVTRRMTRTRFSTRLRPALAQPWIDTYAEFGVIPTSFSAIDLVR